MGFGIAGEGDVTSPGPAFGYDVRSRYGERVANVLEDPGKRNRVLNTVQALLDAAQHKPSVDDDVPAAKASAG